MKKKVYDDLIEKAKEILSIQEINEMLVESGESLGLDLVSKWLDS